MYTTCVSRSSKQVKNKDFEQKARQCVKDSYKDLYTSGDEEEGTMYVHNAQLVYIL